MVSVSASKSILFYYCFLQGITLVLPQALLQNLMLSIKRMGACATKRKRIRDNPYFFKKKFDNGILSVSNFYFWSQMLISQKLIGYLMAAGLLLGMGSCGGPTGDAGSSSKIDNDSIVLLLKSQSYYAQKAIHNSTFQQHYATAIESGNYERAKALVAAYGCAVNDANSADSNFVSAAIAFLEKKYPVAIDSPYAMIQHFVAWDYFLRMDLDKAKYWAEQSLAACTFPNADRSKIFPLGTISGVFVNTNKLDSAIVYYLKDAAISEATNNSEALAVTYFNIGSCYLALGGFERCITYYNKAAAYHLANKDTSGYLIARANLVLNSETLVRDTAVLMATIGEMETMYGQMHTLNFIDSFYYHIIQAKRFTVAKDYVAAQNRLRICKDIKTRNQNYELDSFWDDLMAEWLLAQKKTLTNAAQMEQEAAELEAQQSYYSAAYQYKLLGQNAALLNNTAALAHYKAKQEAANDSATQYKIGLFVFEAEQKFQIEKKEQQIALQQKTIQSKNRSILGLVGGVFFLTTGIIALYLFQKQKRLKKEKQDTQLYSRQLLEKTEAERKRIASDLHDSISSELLSLKSSIKTDIQGAGAKIDDIINDIRIIGRNLHPVMFEKVGLQNSIEQLAERVQVQHNFMLTTDIQMSKPQGGIKELHIYRIVQEAVTNMIKYAQAVAGKITILEQGRKLIVEVKDNGKGFAVKETLSGKGSFGLHNIIERSRAIGGEANIESSTQGTIITIQIPIK